MPPCLIFLWKKLILDNGIGKNTVETYENVPLEQKVFILFIKSKFEDEVKIVRFWALMD